MYREEYNILNGFIDNPIDIKISNANGHGKNKEYQEAMAVI